MLRASHEVVIVGQVRFERRAQTGDSKTARVLLTAMAISGHKTRAVFDRYNIVSCKDLADGAAKLVWLKSQPAQDEQSVTIQ